MSACFTAGVYAQDAIQKVDAYLRSDFSLVVNGQKVALEHTPLVYNDNSYLPVKELATHLGALVNWEGNTKTIYINSRIYAQQPENGESSDYEEFVLYSPVGANFQYLGGTYPVVKSNGSGGTYYRLSDIQRMGIDTNGLKKAKDKITEELYVNEKELETRWKQKPTMTYSIDPVIIIGETNEKKRKALLEFVKANLNYRIDDKSYYTTPIIINKLSDDADGKDKYHYLFIENGHYFRYHIVVSEFTEDNFLVGASSKEDLEVDKTLTDPYGNPLRY